MMKKLTEEQLKECQAIVKGRVISLIGNRTPDWEDLTQDIMLSMTKAMKIFRNEADIKTLLYVVTMRRYYDYLREKYKKKSVECLYQYTIAINGNPGDDWPETRIGKINILLKEVKLTREKRGLLKAIKKTLLSGRLF